jgi:hypothetical protein
MNTSNSTSKTAKVVTKTSFAKYLKISTRQLFLLTA